MQSALTLQVLKQKLVESGRVMPDESQRAQQIAFNPLLVLVTAVSCFYSIHLKTACQRHHLDVRGRS